MQEVFHSMNPGDSESIFIKAGDSEAKEGKITAPEMSLGYAGPLERKFLKQK